ncbi:phosphocholine cytidylyltransferase family protein [Pseudoalteromonas sp. OOF1S-7]|uniref:phosphocholine cytidylyltransferase family protein n=1 Tax=Pseudoalteromonas sp. OOF1S-7 TaxID=2917757 RepID=UPI001EF5FECF|nr:phosphocholine cytidylyltransferase family protein [Pseudoalteromonas sp. OOF1S-7]MCG7537135.1 phosphocholine cytidylyltransferase family protein [Pseudoalteromonas sp. OOF1S-7]
MTKALILAAGQGTRLRPHTEELPKTMVKVHGKAIIEYQLDVFNGLGIDDIAIVGGYHHEKLEKYGLKKFVNDEFESSNMVHSLFKAQAFFDDQDLVISYGDIIYAADIVTKLLACPNEVVVSADLDWEWLWSQRMEDPVEDAESFKYLTDGRVVELGKKLKSKQEAQAQYIGLIKVSGAALKRWLSYYLSLSIDETRSMYMTDFIQFLIEKGEPVHCACHSKGWLEVDSVSDLALYQGLPISHFEIDR